MPNIPDSLPPESLDPFYKALIYLGIGYFILTAITSWLITRRRSKPVRVETPSRAERSQTTETNNSNPTQVTEHKVASFQDSRDMLASLKVEIAGAEGSLAKLSDMKAKDELSSKAYQVLHNQFTSKVSELSTKMNDMLKTDIISKTGSIDSGISDEEMKNIETDLEQQLLALEDDKDFLKPRARAKTPISEAFGEEKVPVEPTRVKVEEPKHEKAQVTHPPPGATPVAKVEATKPMPPPDKPVTMSSPEKPKTEMPAPTPIGTTQSKAPTPAKPATKEDHIPEPPAKPVAPKATQPSAAQPSAAQPTAVQPDGNKEQIFAKSTSIAALRMDMLRELARLKKLINEDE